MSFDQLKQQIYENDFATLNVLKGQIVDNESIFMFPQVTNIVILQSRNMQEGWDIGLFIAIVPKVFNNIFLFDGFTTLRTFM